MPRRYIWTITAALIVSLVSGPSAMLYANRVAAQAEQRAKQVSLDNERKWCSVVETMNRSYAAEPPITLTGKDLAAGLIALRADLRCPPTPPK